MRKRAAIAVTSAALTALLPLRLSAAKPPAPGPGSGTGCVVSYPPPVQPAIRLQTPPPRRTASPGRGSGASSGGIVVPVPPLPGPSACPSDIGGAVAGLVIDPSKLSLSMNLLSQGFHLSAVTLRSDGACGADGQTANAVPVLETAWTADPGGESLFLSQQPSVDPQPDLLDPFSASFGWQGYAYSLQLQQAIPRGGATGPPQGEGPDDAQAVLLQAIAELAPGIDLSCFAVRRTGAWSDLAALGIGDPRPALPPGFSESSFDLEFRTTPPAGCPAAASADAAVYFSAVFSSASGGTIAIGAWSLSGSAPYPGTSSDGSLSWSSDVYQFGVWGDDDGVPLGPEVLAAIARKLDPSFSPACLLTPVNLSEADLGPLGFHSPAPPEGYVVVFSSLTGDVVSPSCATHFDFRGTYSLAWTLAGPESRIVDAAAFRIVSDHPGPRTDPIVSDSCITWNDDRGTSFSVGGSSASGGAGPDRSVLVAVARSLDPGLAISP